MIETSSYCSKGDPAMNRKSGIDLRPQLSSSPRKRIKTTMYNLISALNEEVEAGETILVPLIVLDMMEKGLLKFIRHPNTSR
jgi:hypothetical protein